MLKKLLLFLVSGIVFVILLGWVILTNENIVEYVGLDKLINKSIESEIERTERTIQAGDSEIKLKTMSGSKPPQVAAFRNNSLFFSCMASSINAHVSSDTLVITSDCVFSNANTIHRKAGEFVVEYLGKNAN